METKHNEKTNLTEAGIVCAILGIIGSILVIVMNMLDKESVVVGVVLLCSCTVNLIAMINQKNRNKDK